MAYNSDDTGQIAFSVAKDGTEIGWLIWKKDDGHICYKVNKEDCEVNVYFGTSGWTCKTYGVFHEITYSCSGSASGGVEIESQAISGRGATFTLKPAANGSFRITCKADTDCAALSSEDPGATCGINAQQSGVLPKSINTALAPKVNRTFTITFDSDGKLSGISG